jgi:hypothetical protein
MQALQADWFPPVMTSKHESLAALSSAQELLSDGSAGFVVGEAVGRYASGVG